MLYTVFHLNCLPTEVMADSFEQVKEICPKLIAAVDENGIKYWASKRLGLVIGAAIGLSLVRTKKNPTYNPRRYVNELEI